MEKLKKFRMRTCLLPCKVNRIYITRWCIQVTYSAIKYNVTVKSVHSASKLISYLM